MPEEPLLGHRGPWIMTEIARKGQVFIIMGISKAMVALVSVNVFVFKNT